MSKLMLEQYFAISLDSKHAPSSQTVHWIAIGCASNINLKKIKKLPVEQNQQFPPFLKKIHTNHPDMPIEMLLIDPELENPPQAIQDDIENKWIKDEKYNNVFKSGNMTIYCFREAVTYNLPENKASGLDISSHLEKYTARCIAGKQLLFVHDFSGYNIGKFAYRLDTKNNLRYVMYDISLRSDAGCYIDMTANRNMPIILMGGNKEKYIFNPYGHYYGETRELIDLYLRASGDDVLKEQILVYLKNRIKFMLDTVYAAYRGASLLVGKSSEELSEMVAIRYYDIMFCMIDMKYNCGVEGMYAEFLKKYDKTVLKKIIVIVENILKHELATFGKLLNGDAPAPNIFEPCLATIVDYYKTGKQIRTLIDEGLTVTIGTSYTKLVEKYGPY